MVSIRRRQRERARTSLGEATDVQPRRPAHRIREGKVIIDDIDGATRRGEIDRADRKVLTETRSQTQRAARQIKETSRPTDIGQRPDLQSAFVDRGATGRATTRNIRTREY